MTGLIAMETDHRIGVCYPDPVAGCAGGTRWLWVTAAWYLSVADDGGDTVTAVVHSGGGVQDRPSVRVPADRIPIAAHEDLERLEAMVAERVVGALAGSPTEPEPATDTMRLVWVRCPRHGRLGVGLGSPVRTSHQ